MSAVQQGPAIEASATVRGIVGIGAQTFGGDKTFSGTVISAVASGSDAFSMASGARLRLAAGAGGYVYSDGFGLISDGYLWTRGGTLNGGIYLNAAGTHRLYDDGSFVRSNAGLAADGTEAFNVMTSNGRFTFKSSGRYFWCDEATGIMRLATLGLHSDAKILAALGIGVGNSAAGSALGTVVKKMEVFDAAGASLGFVPIYDAIT